MFQVGTAWMYVCFVLIGLFGAAVMTFGAVVLCKGIKVSTFKIKDWCNYLLVVYAVAAVAFVGCMLISAINLHCQHNYYVGEMDRLQKHYEQALADQETIYADYNTEVKEYYEGLLRDKDDYYDNLLDEKQKAYDDSINEWKEFAEGLLDERFGDSDAIED